MAEFPALPLFTDAYLADTLDLPLAEHGAYLILLMLAWRRPDCAIPDDMKWLKASMGAACGGNLHGHTFNATVPKLLRRFFTLEGGKWTQKRLTKERDYLRKQTEQQRQNIGKRWSKRVQNEFKTISNCSETGGGNEQNQHDSGYHGNTPTSTPTPKSIRKIKKEPTIVGKKESDAPLPSSADNRARGHRLPSGWKPTEADVEFARSSGMDDAAISAAADEFRDYWQALPGQRGVKLDWSSTWRNNIRHRHRWVAKPQKKSRSQEMRELYDETYDDGPGSQNARQGAPVFSIVR